MNEDSLMPTIELRRCILGNDSYVDFLAVVLFQNDIYMKQINVFAKKQAF